MDIEIKSLQLTVAVNYRNERGLTRRAALEFEVDKPELEEKLANKGKFNKFIGDMVKDGMDACLGAAGDEYRGKARPKPDEETPEEVWEEQNAQAEKNTPPSPESEDRSVHPGDV